MGSWLLAPEVSVFNSPSRQGHLLLQVTSMLSTNATTRLLFFKWNLACEQADLHRLFAEKWLCLTSCLPDPQKVGILAHQMKPSHLIMTSSALSVSVSTNISRWSFLTVSSSGITLLLTLVRFNVAQVTTVSDCVFLLLSWSKVFSLWHYPHHTCYEVWSRL